MFKVTKPRLIRPELVPRVSGSHPRSNLPQVARKILLPLKLSFSCLSLTHAEVTGIHHYTQLGAEFLVVI